MLTILFSSVGDVFLRAGMTEVGEVRAGSIPSLIDTFVRTFSTGTIWLGIGSLLAFFVCYLLLLSWADYSYVQPVAASGYALVPLLGYFLLGEQVSALRWSGVTLICLGALLVVRTPAATTTSHMT